MRWELYDGRTTRELEEDALVAEIRAGAVPPAAQVRPVGKEVWKPLQAHAPFAFALGQATGAPSAVASAPVTVSNVVTTRPETSCVTWGCAIFAVGALLIVIIAAIAKG